MLPFLATSPQELSIFKENPDKFLDISMEYTSQKGFESLKGESCGLLKALGRNIDGFLTYVYFLMHEFMLFSVLSNKLEDIQGNYPKIKEIAYHKSFFLHIVSQETRIETSLMVFSVLNEDILRRKDLM